MVAAAIPTEPLLLTARQAAQALSISERTLWTLANRHGLPCVRFGQSVRYAPADLRAWIEKQKSIPRMVDKTAPIG
jgi:excisionase family DNA binding protein